MAINGKEIYVIKTEEASCVSIFECLITQVLVWSHEDNWTFTKERSSGIS